MATAGRVCSGRYPLAPRCAITIFAATARSISGVEVMALLSAGGAFRALVAEGQGREGDGEDAAGHHRDEDAVPPPVVGDPADTRARDRGAEHVAEEAREAGGGPGGVLGDEVEGVEADDG